MLSLRKMLFKVNFEILSQLCLMLLNFLTISEREEIQLIFLVVLLFLIALLFALVSLLRILADKFLSLMH